MTINIKHLSQPEFSRMCHNARIFEQDSHGLKVLQLTDGTFIKLFRVKRALSSANLINQASRFRVNARRLEQFGITTVKILQEFRLDEPKRSGIQYQPLLGLTVRQYLTQHSEQRIPMSATLGRYFALLHQKGVYFRSLHLGNIIVAADGSLGLIDIADMLIRPWPAGVHKVLRNFRIFFRYREDFALYDPSLLIAGYLDTLQKGTFRYHLLEYGLNRLVRLAAPHHPKPPAS